MQTSEIIRSYRQIRTPAMVPALPWWLTGAAVDMDFSNNRYYGGTIGSLLSTSRASSGYATNGDGTLTSFANDTPRIGVGTGLLVEEARTNLDLQSQTLDNASWTKSNATATADQIAAPDLTVTADLITDDATNNVHKFYQLLSNAAVVSTHSVYAKANTLRYFVMYTSIGSITCDAQTGTITSSTGSPASSGVEALANGWYRFYYSGTSTGNDFTQIALATSPTAVADLGYVGTGTGSIYFWGEQFEAGPFPTSYIPTTTVAVTRAADVVTFVGAAGAAFVAGGASVYAQGGLTPNNSDFPIFVGNGNHSPFVNNNGTQAGMYDQITNLLTAAGSSFVTGINKVACGWSPSGRSVVLNGGTVATDAVNQPITGTYYVGSNAAINGFFDAYIKRIALFNSRLPDATLQGLTA